MLNMKWTMSAVMLAAAFAGTASAQTPQGYRGSFDLPFEARFGNTVLPAGHYEVSTFEGARGLRIAGEKGKVSILAAGYETTPSSFRAKMTLVDSNGMYALKSFESGTMGQSFQFVVGKDKRSAGERAAAAKPAVEVGMQ